MPFPKNPQAFQFTGSPDIGPFTLYDDGISNPDSTSNRQTFDKTFAWHLFHRRGLFPRDGSDRAVCSDGSPVDKIDLAPGESVTATFTDTELGPDRDHQGGELGTTSLLTRPRPSRSVSGARLTPWELKNSLARPQALRAES